MSDAYAAAVDRYTDALRDETGVKRSAMDVAEREMVLRERDQAIRDDDHAGYQERLRAQRHHEVLCLVLKELIPQCTHGGRFVNQQVNPGHASRDEVVAIARNVADLAYPPPKQEHLECPACGGTIAHSHGCPNWGQLTPYEKSKNPKQEQP